MKFSLSFNNKLLNKFSRFFERNINVIIVFALSFVSTISFINYYFNGLALSYNDARSHLDIGRRVVEGLKPGLAQIGSVWLPLPHLLMVPTIWNDFMWHTGLAGALQSMIAFVLIGVLISKFLEKLGVSLFGRVVGVLVFVLNVNVLYLQSTAMTELLLLGTLMSSCYYFLLWMKDEQIIDIIKSSFYIMLSTLIRYEGWFLFLFIGALIVIKTFVKKGYKASEGMYILYATLGGLGIVLWFLWNQLIFKDALYFILGPFSAHAQQAQIEAAGQLLTKGNLLLSLKIYLYALIYNSYAFIFLTAIVGAIAFAFDKKISFWTKVACTTLVTPFMFNILALYLGHSVLFIQGISGNTWFNVRYGIMMMPSLAIAVGYLSHKAKNFRFTIVGLVLLVALFAFLNNDAVTIDDARVGSSQKNVSEVSGWLHDNATNKDGFVLISAASHDAIIFSSGLPMKKFIHEGTGAYWESAVETPDRWARWIVMRTNDTNDLTFREIQDAPGFSKYRLVDSYPFADIYELKDEYIGDLTTQPVFTNQK